LQSIDDPNDDNDGCKGGLHVRLDSTRKGCTHPVAGFRYTSSAFGCVERRFTPTTD